MINPITPGDMVNLYHMLGATSNTPNRDWGYRNHYAPGPVDKCSMERLQAAGYVHPGIPYHDTTFFHATEAGCKVAGLNEKQTARAMCHR